MQDNHDLVTAFIISRIPEDILSAYRRLAELTFPISDQKTFLETLRKSSNGEDDKYIHGILRHVFTVEAFPLASTFNALEKFHFLLPITLQIFPRIPPAELMPETSVDLGQHGQRPPPPIPGRSPCEQHCEELFRNSISHISSYDERGRWRSEIERQLCLNRCRRP